MTLEQRQGARAAENLQVDLQVGSRESKTLGMAQVFEKAIPQKHISSKIAHS